MKNQLLAMIPCVLLVTACGTTQKVIVAENIKNFAPETAHLVSHGGRSSDMDNHFKSDLVRRNLRVTESTTSAPADIVVKYDDHWYWDVAMYLHSMEITMLDRSGVILAQAEWKNSPMHTYPDPPPIIKGLLDEVFDKLKGKSVTKP